MTCAWFMHGTSLIWVVYALIFYSRIAGLNLGCWVKNGHIGSFDELGWACQTTQRFTHSPHLAFNLMQKSDGLSFMHCTKWNA